MERAEIMGWTAEVRLGVAGLLATLEPAEWQVRSLCPAWTMHELAAHLTLSTRDTLRGALRAAVRARFDFDRMTETQAKERAALFTPAELIAQIRADATSPRRAPGAGPLDPLADFLVHSQDIARPLGRAHAVPLAPTLAALDHVRSSVFWGARKRLRGIRLIATDCDWSGGDGPDELRGTACDLLLVASGRPAGLVEMTGSGVRRVAAAL
ncbi:maleylpyruvate isomerase family mycothiol-dependent enzyme [Nocardia sp. NPDC050697]|uniref:maleylpyruvate isomerase family mycothiol-dependent enzyme n=1 Tax=Nocardia sp. NPDC050697 TaxID=3155158 RepID=UPI0033C79C75